MKTRRARTIANSEKGFVLVFLAILLPLICLFAGLAIDASYSYVAKGELQNAADSGALAGAGKIYPSNSPPPATFPSPDFTNATSTAPIFVKNNKAGGAFLTDADIVSIQVGYWNLGQNPPNMQPQSTVPKGKCSNSGIMCTSNTGCATAENCLIQDVPAVQVTVRKAVPTYFAKFFGWNTMTPTATAVAVRGYAQGGQGLFPVAVTKCMTDSYFSQNPLPNPPTQITIWGPYGPAVPGCNTGQWTSLTYGDNNVPTIRGLMFGTLPSPYLNIGDNIWIEPGTKATNYQDVRDSFVGKTVLMPVVADADASTHSNTPITGFIAFYIEDAIATGSNKRIIGHFVAYYTDKNTSRPGGPIGNNVTPALLVR